MILLFVVALLSFAQDLLVDSTNSLFNDRISMDFEEVFSVWFTALTRHNRNIEIFSIVQYEQLEFRLTIYNNQMHLESNNQHIKIDINNQQITKWFHLVLSRKDNDYYVEFAEPFTRKLIFDQKISKSIIISNFNKYKACLIYNKKKNNFNSNISRIIDFNQIQPPNFTQFVYFSNSQLQFFSRKQFKLQSQTIIFIFSANQLCEFEIIQQDDQIKIGNFVYDVHQIQLETWFGVMINFEIQFIEVQIHFFDQLISNTIQNDIVFTLFYMITIPLESSDYQFANIIYNSNFRSKFFVTFNDLNICNNNEYLNISINKCQSYLDLPNIILTDRSYLITELDNLNKGVIFDQDQNETQQYFVSQILIQNLLEKFNQREIYLIKQQLIQIQGQIQINFKDTYILQVTDDQILCQQYYFGGRCQKKIRNCKYVNENNDCISCDYQYFLIKRKCGKCPQNCLICQYYKKQLICLIPLHHYFVNQRGLTRYCECQQCKYGRCIVVQEYNSLRIQNKCLIKICPDDLYYDIIKQTCFEIPSLTQQFLNYYIEFLESFNYDLEQTQYQICLSEKPIIWLNQLNRFYFTQQLINTYKENLKQSQIQQYNYYYMNRYNQQCIKKTVDPYGFVVCREYMSKQQEKCNIVPCDYALHLDDVTLKVSSISSIHYQGLAFENIHQLVLSIKDIGLQYAKVLIVLSIIWAFETPSESIYYDINFNKSNMPEHLRYAYFILNIKFSNLILKANPVLHLKINFVNSINILNQEINFVIYLQLSTNNLFMQNLTIINDNSLISSINCNSVILSKVYIFGNSNILLQSINNILIDRFYVQSQLMNSTLLSLKNIQRLELQNIYIQISNIEQGEVFYLYNILQGKIFNLRIILNNTINSTIMWTERCELFEFIEVHITDQNNSNSIYFWKEDCYYVLFQNIQIMGELAENSSAIVVESIKFKIESTKIQFNKLLNTQLLIFQGDELFIWNCNFSIHTSLIIRRIIDINSINAMIENFVLKEKQLEDKLYSINQLDQTFIIKIKITEFGLIKQLKILNLQLIQFGLLQLQCNKVFIQELVIAGINFRSNFDSCLVYFEGYNDNSNYKILNTLFDSIQLFSNQRIIMNLICVKGVKKTDFQQTKFQYISSTNKNQGFLLKFNSTKTLLTSISVVSCININLINIESYAFYLTNLEYDLSSGENLFAIGGKQDQIIKFDNINIIDLQGSVVIVNTSKIIIINIYKLNINKFSQSNLFDMQGMHLRVKFEYLIIIQSTAEEYQDNQYLFKFIAGKNIKMSHLYIKQVKSQFLKVQLAEIVSLQYIIIQNFNNKQRGYLMGIMHSQIFLSNIYLYNINNQFGIIYLFQQEQITFIANIFIKNCSNIGRVIAIDQDGKKDSRILISGINIMKSQIQQIFVFYSQRNMISIHELYMDHTPSDMITGIINQFEIHNSIINDCQEFDNNIFVNQSELIGDNVNFYVNQKLENTLLFNPAKQFIYQDSQLIMSLSFGIGKSFLQVSKSQDFTYTIQKINQKEFFYIPTGCLLSNYKRINFKKIQYQQIYKGFYLVIKGSITQNTSHSNFTCEQQQLYNENLIDNQNYQFLNFTALQGYNAIDQVFRINPLNDNYTVLKIICESIVDQQIIQLQYKVRSLPCQLGEVLSDNQCLVCNVNESKYSVTYNSTKCQYIDYSKIKSAKPGLIELQQNYWRFKFDSQIIEFCDSEYCRGGWIPGDQSCVKSRIGALCKACDLYNIKGDGHYTNNNGECMQCQEFSIRFLFQFLFSIFFQLILVITAYYSNNNISKQYLMFRVGFRQFYKILYRQSVNQPSIIIKMYTNYLFMFYIIRQNFDLMGEIFVININIINNTNLIFQAQLWCLLSQLSDNYIYTQFYYQIIQLFFFLAFVYMIYLLLVLKKFIKFKIGFLIFCTEGIFLFHLKTIIDSAINLLRFKVVSGVKFVRSNLNDLFYSDRHIDVIIFHIIPIASTLVILPILYLLLTKKLVIINRKVRKIFSIFFQEYKASVFYWEYITIYLRYVMMLLITFESEQQQLLLLLINMLLLTNYLIQPYYLKNLNKIDFILVLCFSIQINLVNFIKYSLIVYSPILIINIYLAYFIIYSSYTKVCILYRKSLIDFKQKIVRKIPKISQISGLNHDLRNNSNLDTLRFITKVKFTSNKSTPKIEQLSYHDHNQLDQNKKLTVNEIVQIQVHRKNHLDLQ